MGNGCICFESNISLADGTDKQLESLDEPNEEKVTASNFNHLLKYFNETEKEINNQNKVLNTKKNFEKGGCKNLRSFNTLEYSKYALLLKRLLVANKKEKKNGPKRRTTIRIIEINKRNKNNNNSNNDLVNLIKEVIEESKNPFYSNDKMTEEANNIKFNKNDDNKESSDNSFIKEEDLNKMRGTESLLIMNKNPKKMFFFAQGKQSMTINKVINKNYQCNSSINSNKGVESSKNLNKKVSEGGNL